MAAAARRREDFAYLDVGCSEGRITAAVAEVLGLPPARAHACDIAPQAPSAVFTFAQNAPDALPYPDGTFDFVTAFMAAHHFADAPAVFQEIRRVTRAGARVLIRDHDCTSEAQRAFYDVVHALYACVLGSEMTAAAFVANYAPENFAGYRSKESWIELARECGFAPDESFGAHGPRVKGRYANDRFDSFYALLVRP